MSTEIKECIADIIETHQETSYMRVAGTLHGLRNITMKAFNDQRSRIIYPQQKIMERLLAQKGVYEFLFSIGFEADVDAKDERLICKNPLSFDQTSAICSLLKSKAEEYRDLSYVLDHEKISSVENVKNIIKKAYKKGICKRRMIKILKSKCSRPVQYSMIDKAYLQYFEEERMHEITFCQRPFGFSLIKDSNGNISVFAIQNKQMEKTIKIGSNLCEINDTAIKNYEADHRLLLAVNSCTNKTRAPLPIYAIFKESQPSTTINIVSEEFQTKPIYFDKYWYNKAIVPLFDLHICRICGEDIMKLILDYFNCGDVAV